jgi:hypothetical protein
LFWDELSAIADRCKAMIIGAYVADAALMGLKSSEAKSVRHLVYNDGRLPDFAKADSGANSPFSRQLLDSMQAAHSADGFSTNKRAEGAHKLLKVVAVVSRYAGLSQFREKLCGAMDMPLATCEVRKQNSTQHDWTRWPIAGAEMMEKVVLGNKVNDVLHWAASQPLTEKSLSHKVLVENIRIALNPSQINMDKESPEHYEQYFLNDQSRMFGEVLLSSVQSVVKHTQPQEHAIEDPTLVFGRAVADAKEGNHYVQAMFTGAMLAANGGVRSIPTKWFKACNRTFMADALPLLDKLIGARAQEALDLGLLASRTLKPVPRKDEKTLSPEEAQEMLLRLDNMRENHQISPPEYRKARQKLEFVTADSYRKSAVTAKLGSSKVPRAHHAEPNKQKKSQHVESRPQTQCQTATCKQIRSELDRLYAAGQLTLKDRDDALQKLYATLNPGAATLSPKPDTDDVPDDDEPSSHNATAIAKHQQEMVEIMATSAASVSVKPANGARIRKAEVVVNVDAVPELDTGEPEMVEEMKRQARQARQAGSMAGAWLEALKASADGTEATDSLPHDAHLDKPAPKQHARRLSAAEALAEMRRSS